VIEVHNAEIFNSWKDISEHLNREVRTCIRWEKELGLPVHRIDKNSSRSKVFAYKSEIDEWLRKRPNNERKQNNLLKNRFILLGAASLFLLFPATFVIIYKGVRGSSPKIFSIAVLPFRNSGSSVSDEYFSEGITRQITENLRLFNTVRIIPVPSNPPNNKNQNNADKIGKELKANYILSGNVKKDDNKLNLSVKLVKAKDKSIIWDKTFEEPAGRFSSVIDKICKNLSELLNDSASNKFALESNLNSDRRFQAYDNYYKGSYVLDNINKDIKDPWQLFHQGNFYSNMYDQEANDLAIKLFCQAIEIDKSFAQAYFGLAQCYINYVNFKWDYDVEWLNKAEELAKKAQMLAPDRPEYFTILINDYLLKDLCFNVNSKEVVFNLAYDGIKKYPNDPSLNSIVGYCYLSKFKEEGNELDFKKALEYKEKSFWLNPIGFNNIVYAELLMLNKEFDKAVEVCNYISKNNSSFMTDFRLGEIYYYKGDLDKSESIFLNLQDPPNIKICSLYFLAMIEAQKKQREKVQRFLEGISLMAPEKQDFFDEKLKLASIYMGLGDREQGLRYLKSFFSEQRSSKYRFIFYKYIDIDRNFENIRDNLFSYLKKGD
jgi:TolB-like protein